MPMAIPLIPDGRPLGIFPGADIHSCGSSNRRWTGTAEILTGNAA